MSSEDLAGLLPILVLAALAWFLFIRPARKRAQDVQKLQKQLAPGAEVMLTSGFFGRVVAIDDERIDVELTPGMVVTVHRGAIGKIITNVQAEAAPAYDEASEEAPYEEVSSVEEPTEPTEPTESAESTEPAEPTEPGAPEGDPKSREAN